MYSNNTARIVAASLFALCVASTAHADEKHLTLGDIDGLARQNLVNSMRKTDGAQAPAQGVSLNGSLATPLANPVAAPVVIPKASKPSSPPAPRAAPVTFVGAYSDMTGAHVLYDYQGGVYSAARGERLINGWVVTRVDGYHISVSEGKRTWTEVISTTSASLPMLDVPAVRAITDLGGPLPVVTSVGSFGSNGR
ncbi:hypothetical protein G3N95_15250 [Paraburkholderia sp. Tr-20389]|uniref:hypothetical protein n=1 Tax=Paraburkholderia sp. Tr-20389 TaxID=2703903 RepID=UPI0019800563|nr:hypothetical protein [Paraburkholderia sp. Tr-20389]MBN3754308.1 hypothetical protein [Paraburkholderia sp. Tr-20389]